MGMPYAPLRGHRDKTITLQRIHCAVRKSRENHCSLCSWDHLGASLNVFSRRATGSHKWAKLIELNFLIKRKTFPNVKPGRQNHCHIQSIFSWRPALNETTGWITLLTVFDSSVFLGAIVTLLLALLYSKCTYWMCTMVCYCESYIGTHKIFFSSLFRSCFNDRRKLPPFTIQFRGRCFTRQWCCQRGSNREFIGSLKFGETLYK